MIGRVLLIIGGVAMAAYGSVRLLMSAHAVAVRSAIIWFLGGALAHDLVLAPVVVLVGAILARWCAPRFRPYLQAGLIATGTFTLVAVPVLTGRGYSPKVPSALPLDYRRGYLLAIGIIWIMTVLTWAAREILHRRKRKHPFRATQRSRIQSGRSPGSGS